MSEKEREKKAEEEVKATREAIKSKKLRWKAGITSTSMLSEAEMKNLLGALPEKEKLERKEKGGKKKTEHPRKSGSVDPPQNGIGGTFQATTGQLQSRISVFAVRASRSP